MIFVVQGIIVDNQYFRSQDENKRPYSSTMIVSAEFDVLVEVQFCELS